MREETRACPLFIWDFSGLHLQQYLCPAVKFFHRAASEIRRRAVADFLICCSALGFRTQASVRKNVAASLEETLSNSQNKKQI